MTKIVIYDLETSGIDSAFSSILQAAAVCVDENFNEIDRFNLRGRMKKEYPIPHPKALLVNDVGIDQLKNHENSNFALISEIQNKFLSWGECLFIGYNSIGFDEHHLRQSFYQSALPPYLTNTNGNKRGDALKLLHTAAASHPNAFVRPISDDTGRPTFQLSEFARVNNISQEKAHDALYDVEATLEVCRLIKERCPDVWTASLQTASKGDVYSKMDQDKVFCASRFFRGKEYTHGITYLTKNPTYENHIYCFDLKFDPELVFDLDRVELKKLFKGKGKCFHIVKANEQPILLDEKYLYQTEEYKDQDPEIINKRMKMIRSNKTFIEKFQNLLIDMQDDRDLSQDQSEKLVEKQIYDGFPNAKDNYLMQDFHAALPEKKYEITEKISDTRCKEFAKRVMYNQFPDFLPKNELKKRDIAVAKNHLTLDDKPWCTIPQAQSAIDDLRETEENIDLKRLDEIDEYVQSLSEKFETIVKG